MLGLLDTVSDAASAGGVNRTVLLAFYKAAGDNLGQEGLYEAFLVSWRVEFATY